MREVAPRSLTLHGSVNESHKVTPVVLVKQGSIQIVSQTLPTGTALGREEAATFS